MRKTLLFTLLSIINLAIYADHLVSNDTLSVVNLGEIKVSATKSNTKLKNLPYKVEVISSEAIKLSPAKDLGELLKMNSSVDIIQYPGLLSSVGMRGFQPTTNNKYNALLIDGLPAGTRNISTLGLSNVEQVEILKGPFSSLYGSNAMAGVINIVTPKHKETLQGMTNLSWGSFMTSHADVSVGGRITGPLSFDLSAFTDNEGENYTIGKHNLLKMSETNKAILDKNSYGATFGSTKYSQMGASLRLGYDINKNWEINLFQSGYEAKDVLSGGSFWGVYSKNKKDITRWSSRLELQGIMNNHTIKFSPYYSNDLSKNYLNQIDTAYVTSQSRYETFGAQLQDNIKLGQQNIVVGIDNNTQLNKTNNWKNATIQKAPYNPDYSNTATGVFAQGHFKFFDDKLNISAGARYDFINFTLKKSTLLGNAEKTDNYNIINPNIGIKYEIVEGLSTHANFGTAFLAPDAIQKAGNYTYNGTKYVANPDLKAEQSKTVDFGFGYKNYYSGIESDITFFHTDHKNMITTISVNPDGDKEASSGDEYITYINASKAFMNGLEVLASYDLGALYDYNFSLKTFVNATFMFDTRVKSGNVWSDMKYVRKQNATFGIEYGSVNGFKLRLSGRYIGSRIEDNWFYSYNVRPLYASNKPILHPDYLLFDVSASYSITKKITVGVNVANLLDENYTEKDGYNMPGRSITAKCSVKF